MVEQPCLLPIPPFLRNHLIEDTEGFYRSTPLFFKKKKVIEPTFSLTLSLSVGSMDISNLQIIHRTAQGYAAGSDPRGRGMARVFSVGSR